MTTDKSYFGNTISAEEAQLLATLPPQEAEVLHRSILARIEGDFPQAAERLTGDSRELLEAISRGDRKTPEPSSLGNTDVAEAEESLDRLLDEAGF